MTNGEFHHFDLSKRIPVDLEKLEFRVMNELFAEGECYVEELAKLKAEENEKRRTAGTATPKGKSRKKGPGLREREPWG